MLEYVSEMSEIKQGLIYNNTPGRSIPLVIYYLYKLKTSLTSDNVVIIRLTNNSPLTPSLTDEIKPGLMHRDPAEQYLTGYHNLKLGPYHETPYHALKRMGINSKPKY